MLRTLSTLLVLGALLATLTPAQAVEMDCTGTRDVFCYDGNSFCVVYINDRFARACIGQIVDETFVAAVVADPASACRVAGRCATSFEAPLLA